MPSVEESPEYRSETKKREDTASTNFLFQSPTGIEKPQSDAYVCGLQEEKPELGHLESFDCVAEMADADCGEFSLEGGSPCLRQYHSVSASSLV
jgi:hypothetical protein